MRGMNRIRLIVTMGVLVAAGLVSAEETDEKVEFWMRQLEPVVRETVDGLREARDEFEQAEMEELVEAVAETTGLGEEGVVELKAAAQEAVKASWGAWKVAYTAQVEGRAREQAIPYIEAGQDERFVEANVRTLRAQAGRDRRNLMVREEARPMAMKVWREALAEVLNAEQLAAWQAKKEADAKASAEALERLIRDSVLGFLERSKVEDVLRRRVTRMEEALELTPEQIEDFEPLIGAVRGLWEGRAEAALREKFAEASEAVRWRLLDDRRPGQKLSLRKLPEGTAPEESEIWTKGVEQILGGELSERWAAVDAAFQEQRRKEEAEQFERTLEVTKKQVREGFERLVNPEVEKVLVALELEPKRERERELKAAAERVIESGMTSWEADLRERFEEMDEAERTGLLKRGRVSSWSVRLSPEMEKAWESEAGKVLAAEEWERVAEVSVSRFERIANGLSGGYLAALNEVLWMGPEQIERVRPVLYEWVVRGKDSVEELRLTSYRQFCQALKDDGLSKEIEKWLDEVQRERLEVLADSLRGYGFELRVAELPEPRPSELEASLANEMVMASFMSGQMDWERDWRSLALMAQIDHMSQELDLPPERVRLLRAGAKGAVEAEVAYYKNNLPRFVKRNISQWLANAERDPSKPLVARVSFGQERATAAHSEIWGRSLDRFLSDGEREAWREANEEFREVQRRRMAGATLACLECQMALSGEQREELEIEILKVLKEYEPDLVALYDKEFGKLWYLDTSSSLYPLAGIPKKRFNAILTGGQQTLWKKTRADRASRSWRYLQQARKRREKRGR